MVFTIPMIAVMLFPFCSGSGLSYNYLDEMAQTYCTSKNPTPAYVFAIRRNCLGVAPRCNAICQTAKGEMRKNTGFSRKKLVFFIDHEFISIFS